jgi:hypothetical protein
MFHPIMSAHVYVLFDVREPEHYRYVGVSVNPHVRRQQHVDESKKTLARGRWKATWIRHVLRENADIGYAVIESLDEAEAAYDAEIRWISDLRRYGHRLTNATDGGEGWRFNPWAIPHLREKMLAGQKRAREDPAYLERVSDYWRSFWSDQANRDAQSVRITAYFSDPKNRQLTSEATQLGMTPEVLERVSAGIRAAWQDPEKRERWLAALRSPEERARRSVSMIQFMEDPANRQRVSDVMKEKWSNPEFREQRSAAIRAKGAQFGEKHRQLWAEPQYKADRSMKIALGRRLAKARRNGWVLDIIAL